MGIIAVDWGSRLDLSLAGIPIRRAAFHAGIRTSLIPNEENSMQIGSALIYIRISVGIANVEAGSAFDRHGEGRNQYSRMKKLVRGNAKTRVGTGTRKGMLGFRLYEEYRDPLKD